MSEFSGLKAQNAFEFDEPILYASVVTGISALIRKAEMAYQMECHYPGSDPDRMDDRLKHFATLTATLRRLRDEFETTINQPSP